MAISERQAALGQKFSENVLDATDAFELIVADPAELDGLPADALAAARQSAQADGKEGYKLTLHFPSYFPVMQYANRRELRESLYRAYVTRASENALAPADPVADEPAPEAPAEEAAPEASEADTPDETSSDPGEEASP